MEEAQFDQYASDYESALQQGLSVSGESSDYFAIHRVRWLKRILASREPTRPRFSQVLDFGCGTGNSVEHLLNELPADHVTGVDTSAQSLVQARLRYRPEQATFHLTSDETTDTVMELAYCNGVFHHIPIEQREEAVRYIHQRLIPGGWFAFWENNPWNPGTQYVMSRIPFDRDAIKISIPNAKRLLSQNGFEIVSVDSCFYFPKFLSWLRSTEPMLAKLPLGAQYMILARKR
ncbi:MAG: class I SAM-dependent DNA methyltransferase [Pirellula sp.]